VARRRAGVALLVRGPVAAEIDGLRRACGDGSLGKVPAHITLVPPVNVREERLGEALDVLRDAAAPGRPLVLSLGPAASFSPVSPVAYLRVGGDVDALHALRDRVFRDPLSRPLAHPFVPHVTIADDADPARAEAIVLALAGYYATVVVDRVHLLEEDREHVWAPIADVRLGPPRVVGRGGLPVQLDEATGFDEEGRAFVEREWPLVLLDAHGPSGLLPREPFAITARRERAVVGAIDGWTNGGVAQLERLVVAAAVRGEGIGTHLLLAVEDLARRRGCTSLALEAIAGSRAEAFHLGRGFVPEAHRTRWVHGGDLVLLRRPLS
jgi:2'-5' RNA ligase